MKLIKSDHFGEVAVDVYQKGDELFMTANQLCACLEEDRAAFDMRISRNSYLKDPEFSVSDKMLGTDGKRYATRLFTEDGIYEIAMLSKSPRGQEFRSYVRKLLKALRKGEAKLVSMTEYQRMNINAQMERVRMQKAKLLNDIAADYSGAARQTLQAYAVKELTGELTLHLPELKGKRFTATQLGEEFGVSKNRIGAIANNNGLKTEQYGEQILDKAKGHDKQMPNFIYNQAGHDWFARYFAEQNEAPGAAIEYEVTPT